MLSNRELDDFLSGLNSPKKTTVKKVQFPALRVVPGMPVSRLPIDSIDHVIVDIWAELGETSLTVKEILNMKEGMLIELEKAAGDNINLKVNGQTFATGEVIIMGNNLGIRVDRVKDTKSIAQEKVNNG